MQVRSRVCSVYCVGGTHVLISCHVHILHTHSHTHSHIDAGSDPNAVDFIVVSIAIEDDFADLVNGLAILAIFMTLAGVCAVRLTPL
jgi:hypothetical protein